MSYFDDEDDEEQGEDEAMVDTTKATGDGIEVHINQYALRQIEAACMVGVREEISKKIAAIIDEQIRDIVEQKLGEVVGKLAGETILEYLTKPRPRTNAWGEKVGGTSDDDRRSDPGKGRKLSC